MRKNPFPLIFLLLLGGCVTGRKFKMDQVAKLRCGMPEKEVEAIVGAPVEKNKQDDKTEIWHWRHWSPFWEQRVSIRLKQGKVVELPQTLPGASGGPEWEKHVYECLLRTYPKKIAKAISKRQVVIGMTTQQVLASWGGPVKKNRTVTTHGTHEQWIYPSDRYLYFDNGIMTSLQASD